MEIREHFFFVERNKDDLPRYLRETAPHYAGRNFPAQTDYDGLVRLGQHSHKQRLRLPYR